MTPKERAARYRRLALAEPDKARAAILNQIADEVRSITSTPGLHPTRRWGGSVRGSERLHYPAQPNADGS
jgi:hypothetical protein